MIAEFFAFVLHCFMMVVKLFQNTVIDGITYEVIIVASCMLSVVLTAVVVRFRPGFRPPRPPKNPGSGSKGKGG